LLVCLKTSCRQERFFPHVYLATGNTIGTGEVVQVHFSKETDQIFVFSFSAFIFDSLTSKPRITIRHQMEIQKKNIFRAAFFARFIYRRRQVGVCLKIEFSFDDHGRIRMAIEQEF
jgi:hypothetical protein